VLILKIGNNLGIDHRQYIIIITADHNIITVIKIEKKIHPLQYRYSYTIIKYI
jgi:hypothetical protein